MSKAIKQLAGTIGLRLLRYSSRPARGVRLRSWSGGWVRCPQDAGGETVGKH